MNYEKKLISMRNNKRDWKIQELINTKLNKRNKPHVK